MRAGAGFVVSSKISNYSKHYYSPPQQLKLQKKLFSETPLCLHAESGGQVVWLGTAELGTDLGTAP